MEIRIERREEYSSRKLAAEMLAAAAKTDPENIRFYRGKNAGENNFGIGLSLSRQVLAQQNGTVQAENVLTGGARFILRWYKGTI